MAESSGRGRPPGRDARSVPTSTVASTEAQNSLGEILARVTRGERVFITRYRRREAVILSVDDYRELVDEEPVDLEALGQEFAELVSRMQTSEHGAATDRLFEMSGDELGKAAAGRGRTERPEPAG